MRGRTLPSTVHSEEGVLGGIFLNPSVLAELDDLEVEDFFTPKHQAVFMAMRNLEATMRPIDPFTVEAELKRMNKLDAVGGLAFLGQLALNVPGAAAVVAYADEVRERSVDREVITRLAAILDDVYLGATTGVDAVVMAQKYLGAVRTRRRDSARSACDLAAEELAQAERDITAIDRGDEVLLGMATGFATIDHETGGYPFGVGSLFLAGTGVGKSTALGQATRAASYAGHAAIVYSFEDTTTFWGQRVLAQESGVSTSAIASRRMAARLPELHGSRPRFAARREVIVPAAGWSVDDVLRDARARIRRGPPPGCKSIGKLIVVDYLHRVKLRYGRGIDSRHLALGDAMEAFAALAQDENAAVVAAGQVKREVETEKRMPRHDECLDSSEPPRIAKFVLGMHRPGRYDKSVNQMQGTIAVLKRSQGEDGIVDEVICNLATHTITSASEARDVEEPQQRLGGV